MLTGMKAVRNLLFGESHDLWRINAEQEYHEEVALSEVVHEALEHVFPKLDSVAFGLSVGFVAGLVLLMATLALVVQGDNIQGATLHLLSQFFPGYEVTAVGSLIGFCYAFLLGLMLGWGFAFLRNAAPALYLAIVYRHVQGGLLRQFFDYI